MDVPSILLSHGHLDHSSGVAYHISQRNLRRLPPANIYLPPLLFEPMERILKTWSEIEGYESEYNLHSIDYDKLYSLQANFYFKAIPSYHRVPSNGYVLFEKTRKLRDNFKSLSGKEIAKEKKKEKNMFYEKYIPRIAFSGDTKIEFLLNNESVRQAEALFLECTYIDKVRTIEQTRHWGHLHIDEIVENAEAFRNTKQLFLIHFSPRYKVNTIYKTLKEKLPSWLYEKTIPFV